MCTAGAYRMGLGRKWLGLQCNDKVGLLVLVQCAVRESCAKVLSWRWWKLHIEGLSSKLSVLQLNGIALFMCKLYSEKIFKLIRLARSSVILPYVYFHQHCSAVLALTCLLVIFVGPVILIGECKWITPKGSLKLTGNGHAWEVNSSEASFREQLN